MKTVLTLPRRWQPWLTWPLLGALAAAAAAASLHFSAVRPAQNELEALQQKILDLRTLQLRGGLAARQDPRLQLVRFYASFPSETKAPNWLEQVYAAAQSNHLELLRGDYRIVRKGHGRLVHYQMTLPLKGSYPDIRGFLNSVLGELPSISLDHVAFERQKIGESSVQVTVQLTLYLREAA